jgi:glycylpeptide N-tetradecanoyltransferase
MLPREGVIDSFVVEDCSQPGKITDFISFYTLPSTILRHEKHKLLKVAYSYYNVPGAHSL